MSTTSSLEIIDSCDSESEPEDCVKKIADIDINERVPYIHTTKLDDMVVFKKDFHVCVPNNVLELIETESRPKVFRRNRQDRESNNIAWLERNILKMNKNNKIKLEAIENNYYDKLKICKPMKIDLIDVRYTNQAALSEATTRALTRQYYENHSVGLLQHGVIETSEPLVSSLQENGLQDFIVLLYNINKNKMYVHSHAKNTYLKLDVNDDLFNADAAAWCTRRMTMNRLLQNLHKYCCWYCQNNILNQYNLNRTVPLPNVIFNYIREPHTCKLNTCNCCCYRNKNKSKTEYFTPKYIDGLYEAIRKIDSTHVLPRQTYEIERIRDWCQMQSKINIKRKERPRELVPKLGNALKIKIATVKTSKVEYYLVGKIGYLESYYLGEDRKTIIDAERNLDADIRSRGYTFISNFETTVCCWYSREKFLDSCRFPLETVTLLRSCHTCTFDKCECCCNSYHRNNIKNIQSVPVFFEHKENVNHKQIKILLPINKNIIHSAKIAAESKISLPENEDMISGVQNLLKTDTHFFLKPNLNKRKYVNETHQNSRSREVTTQPTVKRIKTVEDINAEVEKKLISMKTCPTQNNAANLNNDSLRPVENSVISAGNNSTSLNNGLTTVKPVESNFTNNVDLDFANNTINNDRPMEIDNNHNNSSIVSPPPLVVVTNRPPAPVNVLNSQISNTGRIGTIPNSLNNVNNTNTNIPEKIINHPEVQTIIRSILHQFKNVKLIITAEGILTAQLETPKDGSHMSAADLQMLGNLLAYTQELLKSLQMISKTSPLLNLPEKNVQNMQLISDCSTKKSQSLTFAQLCQKSSEIAVCKSSYYMDSLIALLKKCLSLTPIDSTKNPNMNHNLDKNSNQSGLRNQKTMEANAKAAKVINVTPNISTKPAPNVPNQSVLYSVSKNYSQNAIPTTAVEVVKDGSGSPVPVLRPINSVTMMTPRGISANTVNSNVIHKTPILNRAQENNSFQNPVIDKVWSLPDPSAADSLTVSKQNSAVDILGSCPASSKVHKKLRQIAPKPKPNMNQETLNADVNNIDWESRIVTNSLILEPSKNEKLTPSDDTPMPMITEVYSLNTESVSPTDNDIVCLSD